MALDKALNGFTPARNLGGSPNSNGGNRYRIGNALAQDIFRGDNVKVTVGLIQRCSATGDNVMGVLDGVFYIDPVTKKPTWAQYWSSATSAADAAPYANVVDNPMATFYIQADASVTVGDVGLNFSTTLGAGSTITGRSGFGLKASTRSVNILACRVLDIKQDPRNAFGDAFPIVEVKFADNQQLQASASVA